MLGHPHLTGLVGHGHEPVLRGENQTLVVVVAETVGYSIMQLGITYDQGRWHRLEHFGTPGRISP